MEILVTICSILGVSGIVSAFVNRRLINIEKRQEERSKAVEHRQEEQEKRNKAVENGVQALIRANIISLYNKYTDKGYIPIYERENLEHLYTEYKTLGGNGVIESLLEKLADLPTPPHDHHS